MAEAGITTVFSLSGKGPKKYHDFTVDCAGCRQDRQHLIRLNEILTWGLISRGPACVGYYPINTLAIRQPLGANHAHVSLWPNLPAEDGSYCVAVDRNGLNGLVWAIDAWHYGKTAGQLRGFIDLVSCELAIKQRDPDFYHAEDGCTIEGLYLYAFRWTHPDYISKAGRGVGYMQYTPPQPEPEQEQPSKSMHRAHWVRGVD